jgi:hypothetical protein
MLWELAEKRREDYSTSKRPNDHGLIYRYDQKEIETSPPKEIMLMANSNGGGEEEERRNEFFKFVYGEFEQKYFERAPVIIHAPGALESVLTLDKVLVGTNVTNVTIPSV